MTQPAPHKIRPALTRERFDRLVDEVCKQFQVSRSQLLKRTRSNRQASKARLALYVLIYESTSASLLDIGWYTNRHHTTVMDGLTSCATWQLLEPELFAALQATRAALAPKVEQSI